MMASDDTVIVIDVGNSSVRLGVFALPHAFPVPWPDDQLQLPAKQLAFDQLDTWLPGDIRRCYVASVYRDADQRLQDWLRENRREMRVTLLRPLDFPIKVDFPAAELVGADRLAAATAANALRNPQRPAIVVDSGTAITVDAVDRDGRFAGGAIAPGWRMSAEALHRVADLLPLVEPVENAAPPPAIGKNTAAAIRSGLFWGAIGTVRELVRQLETALGDKCDVLITGGGSQMLVAHLGGMNAKSYPDLVLSGIAIAGRGLTR